MEQAKDFYQNRRFYIGDIHNHCDISYGHGSLDDALYNAALQLDFVSVTGHAGWPDMKEKSMPEAIFRYHWKGFERLRTQWENYLSASERENIPGKFVTFFSYEYHSFRYGDRVVVTPFPPIISENPYEPMDFASYLNRFDAHSAKAILLPHHIGYRTGYRGLDWTSVADVASPLVEIFSMHGLAESDENFPFPYLHTMGPLTGDNTMQSGLSAGHHFGVTASTDHHFAHPGSYGWGRTGVWAENLTRESIWEAFLARQTIALTGDRIKVAFSVDGAPLGSQIKARSNSHHITATIQGEGALDRVEVIKNNKVIRNIILPETRIRLPKSYDCTISPLRGIVNLEFGWGQKGEQISWDVQVEVVYGSLIAVLPRLRGSDVVDPLDRLAQPPRFSSWEQPAENTVIVSTMTFGNATPNTPQMQGLALDIAATNATQLIISAAGKSIQLPVSEIADHSKSFYIGGFTSPAIRVHRFVAISECEASVDFIDQVDIGKHERSTTGEDWYYMRVFQRNGQAAWTSPIWVSI